MFDQIRDAMLHRSEVLGEAAESAGAVVSEESASILRVKAMGHVEKVEVRKKHGCNYLTPFDAHFSIHKGKAHI